MEMEFAEGESLLSMRIVKHFRIEVAAGGSCPRSKTVAKVIDNEIEFVDLTELHLKYHLMILLPNYVYSTDSEN